MMKKNLVVWLFTLMMTSLLLPESAKASNVSGTVIMVDGRPVSTPVMLQKNYQLVPAAFFRSLQRDVSWSSKYKAAVIQDASISIAFPAGRSYTDYGLRGSEVWQRDQLPVTIVNAAGTVYVPLAYTATKLGLHISYDSRTKQTAISTTAVPGQALAKVVSTQVNQVSHAAASQEDLKWLYQITEAEAGGESFAGKVAVAAAILNRVASSDWPNSIQGTIFHVSKFNGISYYQFSPVLDKRIYSVTPSEDTKQAVHAALEGQDPSFGAVVFYNPDKTDNAWVRSREVTVVIGNHVFAK